MQKISEDNLTEVYLTPEDLALRWNLTLHTLEQWRWKGRGPQFFKAGSLVRYPVEEVEKFEAYITQTPKVDYTDKRFLCVDLTFRSTEGIPEGVMQRKEIQVRSAEEVKGM